MKHSFESLNYLFIRMTLYFLKFKKRITIIKCDVNVIIGSRSLTYQNQVRFVGVNNAK